MLGEGAVGLQVEDKRAALIPAGVEYGADIRVVSPSVVKLQKLIQFVIVSTTNLLSIIGICTIVFIRHTST